MAFDYFTIQTLAQELRSHLQGAIIERAYAQPTELAFAVDEDEWLYGASGREGLLCLRREAWPRSWRAGDGPEKYLVQSARSWTVEAECRERILRLRLERRRPRRSPELWRLSVRTHSQQNAVCSPSPS